MNANLGGLDRILRGVVGIALIIAGFIAGMASPWNMIAMGAGAVFTLTALVRFCPLYTLLGISTCSKCSE